MLLSISGFLVASGFSIVVVSPVAVFLRAKVVLLGLRFAVLAGSVPVVG